MLLKICVASGRRSSMNMGMLLLAPGSTNKFDVCAPAWAFRGGADPVQAISPEPIVL
jgi:hypothetical protein